MKDLVTLNSKVVELSSKSKTTREIIMYVHTIDEENLNGLTFTLSSTEKYKDTLVNKPVVVKMNTTESDFKGHEPVYDESGNIVKLDTIAIGTITETWIEDKQVGEVTKKALMARAVIWSYKFPTAIEIMESLFDDGNLDTSVEVAIFSYTSDSEPEHRKTSTMEYLSNCLLGSMILPADSNAGVVEMFWKEVAQALSQNKPDDSSSSLDINSTQVGGVRMLSHDEIRTQLRALLNPSENEQGGWKIDYWTWDMVVFDGFCVARHAESGKLFRFDYEIQDESTVVLNGEPREQMIQYVDVPQGEEVEVAEWVGVFKELQNKVQNYEQKEQELNTQLTELNEQKTQLETEIAQLKEQEPTAKVDDKDETLIKLNSVIEQLKEELASLAPIKAEYDQLQEEKRQAELMQKQESLKTYALNSKVVEEQEFESNEELKNAIAELNEQYVKALIADRIVNKAKDIELNSKNPDEVVILSTEGKDLIPQNAKDLMYAPKQK